MTIGRHLAARTVARPLLCYSAIVYMWVPLLFIIILVIPCLHSPPSDPSKDVHIANCEPRGCVTEVCRRLLTAEGWFQSTTMDTGPVVKKQHCDVRFSKYFGFPQLVFHQMFRTLWPMPGMENGLVRGHASRDYYHNKKTKIAEHKNLLSAAIGCFYNQNTRYRLP
jgi:hypothetical protein